MTRRAALLAPWIEQAAISLLIREDRAEAERLLRAGLAASCGCSGCRAVMGR